MSGILLSAVVAVGAPTIGSGRPDRRPRPPQSGRTYPDFGDLRTPAAGCGNPG
ncbi:hypothetical protein [Streptomyces sp. NPDC005262]|uniref:hypothetical protein n=1 Tax=Streptomyces sp. NPDC005262 TaxID=3364710 RepID=UPI0036A57566